ncbi:hypothetical protein M885DRAFT_614287 [Pelagophyceae sp. CCMP2097]|nr:hypothetical protein M885DRAFT_614287 [Pelagophyceae sp. CCMP2097]
MMPELNAAMAAANLPAMDSPQMVGIVFGCTVFCATLTAVAMLLIFGGSFERMKLEAEQGPQPVIFETKPKIVEHLLQRALELPLRPALFEGDDVRRVAICGDVEVVVRDAREGDDLSACADGSARFGEAAYDNRSVWRGETDVEDWDEADGALLAVEDSRLGAVIGCLRLELNRPTHLGVSITMAWLHPAYCAHVANAQKGDAANLAVFEVLSRLFAAGYRRVEALVDTADGPRKALFESFGFSLEGVLRKHLIVDERSRDTAVYALLNTDWHDAMQKQRLNIKIAKH